MRSLLPLLALLLAAPAQAAVVLEAGAPSAGGARSVGASWALVGTLAQLQPVGVATDLQTIEGGLWYLPELDSDGDGWADADDCDPFDASTWPGASELADDGFDQDCNGFDAITCWTDSDGDGFGAEPLQLGADAACDDPTQTLDDTDCDDADPDVSPAGVEACDALDSDCDGELVDGFPDLDADGLPDCVDPDADGDGFASPLDCDDADPLISPDGVEVLDDGVDQDCDGFDTITCYVDDDGDGDGTTSARSSPDGDCDDEGEAPTSTDCDDANIDIYFGAPEVVDDGIDQDCDGFDTVRCYEDEDDDGYGTTVVVLEPGGDCEAAGQALVDTDCDDDDPLAYPGATEVADDGVDQDCSGADTVTCFDDGDGDGFGGDLTLEEEDCSGPDLVTTGGDCDDEDAAIHPAALEVCDLGVDNDCDPSTDEDADVDGDGISICQGDCDDANATVHPGAFEVCDGLDTDCFPFTDDDESDADGDESRVCDGDCDDEDPLVYPEAIELCDGVDNDCDGAPETDEQVVFLDWFLDADGDGFGDPSAPHADSPACDALDGAVANAEDCADEDAAIHPDADELCDGVDNDCDPTTDLDGLDVDVDEDGYLACADDCDDGDEAVNPAAIETCEDEADEDCDGREATDEGEPECWEGACDCQASLAGHGPALGLLLLAVGSRRRRVPRRG